MYYYNSKNIWYRLFTFDYAKLIKAVCEIINKLKRQKSNSK